MTNRLDPYTFKNAIAFDRLCNALIGGDPDETMSSVAFRKHRDGGRFGFMMYVINALAFDRTHCAGAYTNDRNPDRRWSLPL